MKLEINIFILDSACILKIRNLKGTKFQPRPNSMEALIAASSSVLMVSTSPSTKTTAGTSRTSMVNGVSFFYFSKFKILESYFHFFTFAIPLLHCFRVLLFMKNLKRNRFASFDLI